MEKGKEGEKKGEGRKNWMVHRGSHVDVNQWFSFLNVVPIGNLSLCEPVGS